MSYFSAPLKFCLLLLPFLGLVAGFEPASAEEMAVSFDLPPVESTVESTETLLVRYQDSLPPIEPANLPAGDRAVTELEAASEPSSGAIALQFAQDELEMPIASSQLQNEMGTVAAALEVNSTSESLLGDRSAGDLSWSNSGRVEAMQQRLARTAESESVISAADLLDVDIIEDWIYEGGSDSLVARTVGSAEGTRRSNGERTTAYYGHTDPGNGVWNLGTFSYQHAASSPEDADEKQLKRLHRQERKLKEKAAQWNVPMSLEVRLNGLDLANQAPLAALDKGGYIERLAEAYDKGKSGEAAISWARTHAYFDPDKQAWDAPGLGNNRYSIQRDQERRMAAIDSALRRFEYEHAGQISGLSELRIASASSPSTANDSLLLAQPEPAAIDSTAILDFSLDPVSFSEPAIAKPQPVERPAIEKPLAGSTDPAVIDPISREAAASNRQTSIAELAAIETTATIENDLSFEDDQLALYEWDERDEVVAQETAELADAEAIEVDNDWADNDWADNDLVFEADEIADILAENEPLPNSPTAIPQSENETARLDNQPKETAPEESAQERLSRLQAGVIKRDLALPAPLSSQPALEESLAVTEDAVPLSMRQQSKPAQTHKKPLIRIEESIVRSK